MAHKHLHELLEEDQEPFVLKNYIDDRRCQLKRPVHKTHLQVKRRKPISDNSSFPGNFCRNTCFSSFHDSPDVTKSPLFGLFSHAQSPCRNSNTISVHIPATTAAVLLEAAIRIQKQSSSTNSTTANRSLRFGLFGSVLKRLTHRKRKGKPEIRRDDTGARVEDSLRWDSSVGSKQLRDERHEIPKTELDLENNSFSGTGFSCSCNSRLSSAWSESNEEKSLDLETSSSRSEDSDEMEFVVGETKMGNFSTCESGFCASPFRFSLLRSPSPVLRTPEFQSPVTSPNRHKNQVNENDEEEEKEQCSPVSVLDPPFEDDDIEVQEDDAFGEDELELDPSFTIVQRTKQHLLQKLCRFERLAQLDPIELEKTMATEQESSEGCDDDDHGEKDCDELLTSVTATSSDKFVKEVLSMVDLYHLHINPPDMRRLVSDLIAEEIREEAAYEDKDTVVKRVCRRLESSKEAGLNTIDMMVELDLRREGNEWRKYQEQVQETAVEIELGILGRLLEELSEELVCSVGRRTF